MSNYECKWCGGYHEKKMSHLYCEMNPDRDENWKRMSNSRKKVYQKNKHKLMARNNTPEARLKKSMTVKKHWKNGVYDDVQSPRFKGKSHTLSTRAKISRSMTRVWALRAPEIIEKQAIRHDVINPMISSYSYEDSPKTLVGGEFFEEDFFNYEEY